MTWILPPLNCVQTRWVTPDAASLPVERWRGQPCVRVQAACGDTAVVALQGAQVLSWVARGRECLYLSPAAVADGHTAIRGGIPLCFPQFNARGPLTKHGFARNLMWSIEPMEAMHSGATNAPPLAVLTLSDSAATRAQWPHHFCVQLAVEISDGSLRVTLSVRNTGSQAWQFTTALHTYLRINDLEQARVLGLSGQARWDAVTDTRSVQQGDLRVAGEYDSVFTSAADPLVLHDGADTLLISQSATLANTVVWNPGAVRCADLADMPRDGYAHMLCVEAAQIDAPVCLAPDTEWLGWQQLSLG